MLSCTNKTNTDSKSAWKRMVGCLF